jgi:predicted O-methyltransferase YrrM
VPEDPALEAALSASGAAGLPAHEVSLLQGRFLELLARLCGARAILELGTLGGVSTIALARGLAPDGHLVTLEANPAHAEVARANLARAGLAERVEIRVGPALPAVAQLAAEGAGPFDLVFLDADKRSNPEYLRTTLALTRGGSLIVADNVVRGGAVADADSTDATVRGVRRFHELLGGDPRLVATAIQTVGVKGYDGFALALVVEGAPEPGG